MEQAGAWPEELGQTLVSAGTHELAYRLDVKECTKYAQKPYDPGKHTQKAVAKALRLRSELIEVHVPTDTSIIKEPLGAVRQITATYNSKGELADFVDRWRSQEIYGKEGMRDLRTQRDVTIVVYVKEPVTKTSYPPTRNISVIEAYGVKPKKFKSDDRDAEAIYRDLKQSGERFGPKPDGVTLAQWGALQKLHLNLSHPSAQALKRRLRSYGVLDGSRRGGQVELLDMCRVESTKVGANGESEALHRVQ